MFLADFKLTILFVGFSAISFAKIKSFSVIITIFVLKPGNVASNACIFIDVGDVQYEKSATKLTIPLNFDTFYEFLELQFINICDIGVNIIWNVTNLLVIKSTRALYLINITFR